MTPPADRSKDRALTENEDQKPGSPPRPASEPAGGGASRTGKTQTDAATGEPTGKPKGSEKV